MATPSWEISGQYFKTCSCGGLIEKFLGTEQAPIQIDRNGLKFNVNADHALGLSWDDTSGKK